MQGRVHESAIPQVMLRVTLFDTRYIWRRLFLKGFLAFREHLRLHLS